MPGAGRNDPCPCGSGRKTKRCCGERRGPSEEQLARARLAVLSAEAAEELAGLSDEALHRLRDDVFDLPALDLSLQVKLPELIGRDRKRLQRAIVDPNSDSSWETVSAMAKRVDTPQERARLAEALTEQRREGVVSARVAALATFDLSNGGEYFFRVSTIHALATYLGGDPTPGGLLVAA